MIVLGNNTLYHGDNLEVMKDFPDSSIDTVITDPPYALEFMGKGWDKVLPSIEVWRECLRVAKPGAILLAFGGTRTFHRLTCNIEDAGWEIRDCIMWVYGSGFPKSLDVSKAIDKAAGATREIIGSTISPDGRIRMSEPSAGQPRSRLHGGGIKSRDEWESAPATKVAQQWDGWGTALKPAWEPIIMAMKPLEGTYAQNALKHGVAGLNIDGSRILGQPESTRFDPQRHSHEGYRMNLTGQATAERAKGKKGRWPANLILDGSDEVLERFPQSSVTGKRSERSKGAKVENTKWLHDNHQSTEYIDKGSAARFFYCAKASRAERGAGNNHPTVKPLALMEYLCTLTKTPTGGIVLDPFMGSGTTLIACKNTGRSGIGIEQSEHDYNIAIERNRNMKPEQVGIF